MRATKLFLVVSWLFLLGSAHGDIFDRITECEKGADPSCQFDILRELAGKIKQCDSTQSLPKINCGKFPTAFRECMLHDITTSSGWKYILTVKGEILTDRRWDFFGGSGNGTNDPVGACDFFNLLIREGKCD